MNGRYIGLNRGPDAVAMHNRTVPADQEADACRCPSCRPDLHSPSAAAQVAEPAAALLACPADARQPSGSEAWLDVTGAARLFHMRDGSAADAARMARVLTGRSVGLVLSGGGARAYAHIGAIQALRERGVPIDFVGGASMGAIVAAGVAMGWDEAEMDVRIKDAFVDSSPLDDIAFPLIAMTHGEKVRERLRVHFDDTQIADLWLPFFCVSSNLTTGAYHLHKRGTLRHALRASIALPGVMPPAIDNKNVLVDGAVMKNFPSDVMRRAFFGERSSNARIAPHTDKIRRSMSGK